jgi:hypothetical protein
MAREVVYEDRQHIPKQKTVRNESSLAGKEAEITAFRLA